MSSQVEQITNRSMSTKKSLRLANWFEFTHLPHPSRLVRLLRSIFFILLSTAYRHRNQLAVNNTIAAQFIGHDLSWLAVDFDEDWIDVECIAIASGFSLQAAGINGCEINTPKTD
ncbi:MAG: hypothetical protein ACJAZ0_001184 [Halioglobus sp.]|jgi:hypothetical protein